MAKKVTKYEDIAGGLHDTLGEAQAADKEALVKEQLMDIARSIHTYNMTADELGRELFEYRTSLRGVLCP